jgi:hypothetical protein
MVGTTNKSTAAMSSDDFALLQPHVEPVPLKLRQTLVAPNKRISHNYSIERGIASIIAISNGRRLKSGSSVTMASQVSRWLWEATALLTRR